MPPAGFEPATPASERPQTATLTASGHTAALSPLRSLAEILQAALGLKHAGVLSYVAYHFSRRLCMRQLPFVVICKGQARSVWGQVGVLKVQDW